MIIMYSHQPIQIGLNQLKIMDGNENIRFIGNQSISDLMFLLFSKYGITKTYLLGQTYVNTKQETAAI